MTSLLRCEAQVDFVSKLYHVSIYQLNDKILICTSFGGVVYAKWKKHVRFFDVFDFLTSLMKFEGILHKFWLTVNRYYYCVY